MTTQIEYYASRKSLRTAVRWTGSDSCYRLIEDWGANVERFSDILILQEPDRTVTVREGDYIIRMDEDFYRYTEEELSNIYVKAIPREENSG